MEDTLCSKELSLLAKEKGFDWPTEAFYKKEKEKVYSGIYNQLFNWNSTYESHISIACSAPTLSHLHKWCREETDYYVEVVFENDFWHYIVKEIIDVYDEVFSKWVAKTITLTEKWYLDDYISYEDALEQGLYDLLTLIKEDEQK